MSLVNVFSVARPCTLAPAAVLLRQLTQTTTSRTSLMDWPDMSPEDKKVYAAFRSSANKDTGSSANIFSTRTSTPDTKLSSQGILRKVNDSVLGRRNLHTAPHRQPESDSESVLQFRRPQGSITPEDQEVRNAFFQSVGAQGGVRLSRPSSPDDVVRAAFRKSVETIREENRTIYTRN